MIHVLYLDDSGSSGNKDEEYLVLGGVCVPEKSLRWLSNQLNELVQRFAKDSPQTVEFHAVDIFGGRSGIWRQYKDRQSRVNIIKQVLGVLDNAYREVHTYACAVHKPSCAGDPLHEAYETISSRFDSYLKGLNEEPAIREHKAEAHRGLIVMDKSTYELSLQSLAANIRQDGNRGANT